MHQPLENYLNRIKFQLKGIPTEQRDLQIQEIAQHLQRMIAEEMEGGLSEADAVLVALAQFGKPKEIGRGLRAATGGTKTGVWLGMAMGACVGIAVAQIFWLLPLLSELRYASLNFHSLDFVECMLAALSGAIGSLVGRRFTWRHLLRPSGRHPALGNWTRDVAVCCRFFEVGMFRGGFGGAIYAFCDAVLDSYTWVVQWDIQFPSNPPGFHDFIHFLDIPSLPFRTGIGVAAGALLVGILNACVGLGLRAKEKRDGRRAWLT